MKNVFFLILLFLTSVVHSQNLVINEVMPSNNVTIFDEDGDASDWLELYNPGTSQMNLEGYYISDDSLNLTKWQFRNIVINPGEYLIVFASDKDTNITYCHTNFKISASGETILLSDTNGNVIDQVDVPAIATDVSYARTNDGQLPWIFQFPSPGASNTGNAIQGYADSVTFSIEGGFYTSEIVVELSAGDSEIYYTLDGSDPHEESFKYASPIVISKTTILRVISTKTNYSPSAITQQSYFVDVDTDLPVISLITDPDNLWDYNTGIYADGPGWTPNPPNYGANFWMDWERPAHIQFFDDDKNLGFAKNCGISIHGAYTRSFPMKSFNVKFKNDYNETPLEYDLFPGFRVKTFKSLILRNSGNDFQFTHFRDAMQQSLISDLDIDYLEYRPAAAYINGEYWGIYNIREKISEHYFANRHGIDPDNIDVLEGNMEVTHGDTVDFAEFKEYISNNDMTTQEAYDYVISKIDLDNCLLYWASQVYFNSQDWPANNLMYWRPRTADGKWRWVLFDVDFGFNLYETTGQSENHLTYILSGIETRPGSNPPWSTLVPRMLVKNPTIRDKFINLIADLLNTNFKIDKVVNRINEMKEHIANEGPKHRERWNISQWTFDGHIQRMISFAQERPAYLRDFVRDYFACGFDGKVTINITQGGSVNLNTVSIKDTDSPWSGSYFMNIPVEVKAIADAGYKFDGWTGAVTSNEESITLPVSRTTNLYASFSVDSSGAKDIVINEINYNSADDFDSGDWVELYNPSDQSIDIGNWYFSDSDDNHRFIFPDGTVLNPDNYLVIVENDSAFTSRFPDVENYIGETGFGLSGSGEFIKLVNDQDQIIDSLTYDDKSPWPVEADGTGATLELIDAGRDNSVGENWKASDPHGTPGNLNSSVTYVEENKNTLVPQEFSLSQNYPNPFNPETVIHYSIPRTSHVTLKVYDILGREVQTLVNGVKAPGLYSVTFNGQNFSSGIYLYQIKADGFMNTRKLNLLK